VASSGALREGASSASSVEPSGSLATSAGVGGCTLHTSATSAYSDAPSTTLAPIDS
jgi:hypothetical protein